MLTISDLLSSFPDSFSSSLLADDHAFYYRISENRVSRAELTELLAVKFADLPASVPVITVFLL